MPSLINSDMMSPSLVSSKMNMANWEREAAYRQGHNDDEEYEQEGDPSPNIQWGDAPAASAAAGIHSPPHQATTSNQTPFAYHMQPDYNDDEAVRVATAAAMPASPYYPPGHVPIKQEDSDYERKPAALADNEGEAQTPTHRKRHSLTSDPFQASGPDYEPQEQPPQDQFINPSLSFVQEEAAWSDAERLAFQQDQAAYASSEVASPPAPVYPQPINYRFSDKYLQRQLRQRQQEQQAASSRAPAPRSSSRNTRRVAQRTTQRGGEGTEEHRRGPSDLELAAAATPRARAAIETWYERFHELAQYKRDNGDCNVPQKYPPNPQLGIWVNKQRMEKKFMDEGKKSSMTVPKLEALESIGFQWAKRKGEAAWMQKYQELVEYRNIKGNCDVATKYAPNPALGRWVSTQRSEYKKYMDPGKVSKHMTEARVQMLDELGFRWEMIPSKNLSSSSSDSD